MTSPPGHAPTPSPTGGFVSADAANAAAALRRAGHVPTPGLIRQVLRARRACGEIVVSEFDWWDRLVRSLPLGLKRPRKPTPRPMRVTS